MKDFAMYPFSKMLPSGILLPGSFGHRAELQWA